MKKPTYLIETSEDGFQHNFESIGKDKIIKKSVRFYPFEGNPNIYELSFGDINDDGTIDVKTVSNNDDMIIVLNTVVQTIYRFFELNPNKSVAFMGSSLSRNRLYRVIIGKLYDESSDYFEILGWNYDGTIEEFIKNKDYFAFQISLK